MRTDEERMLLDLLNSGALDGYVGDDLTTSGGSTVWMQIKGGIPAQYKEGPGGKFFDGKENTRYSGKLHVLQEWKTDDAKLAFLQKYGWLMDHPAVRAYSVKFKPRR